MATLLTPCSRSLYDVDLVLPNLRALEIAHDKHASPETIRRFFHKLLISSPGLREVRWLESSLATKQLPTALVLDSTLFVGACLTLVPQFCAKPSSAGWSYLTWGAGKAKRSPLLGWLSDGLVGLCHALLSDSARL